MLRPAPLLSLLCSAATLAAQNPCEGFGGSAYLSTTAAIVGGNCELNVGSPAAPSGIGVIAFCGGGGPAFPLCVDTSGFSIPVLSLLDASGNAAFNLAIPTTLFGAAPMFAKGLVLEGAGNIAFSKTVRLSFEHANSSREVPPMATARSMHTCTAFESSPRDNRIGALVAGGASGSMIFPIAVATTERFDSVTRTWSAGPTMAVPRTMHRAVRLLDGRILISGGMTNAPAPSFGGPATASCEIYDPATSTLSATGSMLRPRMGHGLTVLNDGRVLASGGLDDWTDAALNFEVHCASGTTTTEIWNPATGAWSSGPAMNSLRAGHSQTLLADGRVLIAGGVNGGATHVITGHGPIEVPTFTASCELFDPTTSTLTVTAPLAIARAFHGASRLPNGDVLLSFGTGSVGGHGEAAAVGTLSTWSPATGTWTDVTAPVAGAAFHTHSVDLRNGAAMMTGGFNGNFETLSAVPSVVVHDGVAVTAQPPLGMNPGQPAQLLSVGTHAAAALHDGTVLVTGGYLGNGTSPTGTTFNRALLLIAP